jgi:hypothetical protein
MPLRYTADEIKQRGDAIYERDVAPNAAAEDHGRFVAIDVESGAFEIAHDQLVAVDRLFARKPDAQIWFRRVGFPYVHHR